ncbi:MAG: hypothetical protein HFJ02_02500 [Bacilli bacterium]|nr:hypothetical protein [Bacilli bacterium]
MFIKGYDQDYNIKLHTLLLFPKDLNWFNDSIWKFLNADFLCSFSVSSHVLEVKKMDETYLTIKDEDGFLSDLYEQVKEKYFNDRLTYFLGKSLSIRTIHFICSSSNPFSRFESSQDKTKMSISLLLKEGNFNSVDIEFINTALDFLIDYRGGPLVLYEHFYFQNQQAISLGTYLLKKGKVKVYFNAFLYNFMLEWISMYERVSSKKAIKVLNGYRTNENVSDKSLIRERLHVIKGGII